MILANILISDREIPESELPITIRENIESFKRAHPGIKHQLFQNEQIREFIGAHFDRDILKCYDQLKPFAYKSDLARLCIIHRLGGIYADLSCYFLMNWPPVSVGQTAAESRLAVFRDFLISAPWDTSNTVFFAPAGHKALLRAITLIRKNVRDRFYGIGPLSPTGPELFGKAIALSCEPEDLIAGESVFARAPAQLMSDTSKPAHFFAYRGQLCAFKRKRLPGLDELGFLSGNNYDHMWSARDVYVERAGVERSGAGRVR